MSTSIEPEQTTRSPHDLSRMLWREYTNRNGKKYRVGYDIPVGEDLEKAKEIVAGFKDPNSPEAEIARESKRNIKLSSEHSTEVHWTYKDGVFYKTTDQVKDKVGIYEYQLGWNHSGWYNYKLTIWTNEAWYYAFYDQDQNYYTLDVDVTWWSHNVCFDTDGNKRPIIEKIKAVG